jgi:hypothetical protein
MLRFIHSLAKPFIVALLMAGILSLTCPRAAAADLPSDTEKSIEPAAATSNASSADPGASTYNVLFAAFSTPLTAGTEPAPEPATRPRRAADLVPAVPVYTPPPIPAPAPAPKPSPYVVSTAPMTAGEKFGTWFRSRFLSIGPVGSALFSGMIKELEDNDDNKEDTVENYFADGLTRSARAWTMATTSSFYEKAVLASLFRQDPRYHRSGYTGAKDKFLYAVTRVFVTQGDNCGCNQPNYSFLLGGAAASVTANAWERSERGGPWHMVRRYYTHIALTAMFNIVREFVGGQ